MAKSKNKNNVINLHKPRVQKGMVLVIGFLGLFFALLVGFNLFFVNRAYPNIVVAGISIGKLDYEEIINLLKNNIETPSTVPIKIGAITTELNLNNIDFSYDIENTAHKAISVNKNTNKILNLFNIPQNLVSPVEIPLLLNLNDNKLNEYLKILADEHLQPAIPYSINLKGDSITIDQGKAGQLANTELLKQNILSALSNNKNQLVNLEFEQVNNVLNNEEVVLLKERAEKLIGKSVSLQGEYENFTLTDSVLVTLLDVRGGLDDNRLLDYLNEKISPNVEREPQNASFVFNDEKVEEFAPAKDGIEINDNLLVEKIKEEIHILETEDKKTESINIPFSTKSPDISLSDVNNLGIKELVGRGVSYYKGSISSRIFNVGHASGKFKSVLVPPGEVFSFNNILGDISALTGYKQAYIIKDGRTVLGDGGGVCQVSTTLFRAVLDAGLPVVERRAHAYRVGYYEQDSSPGLDATVYYPTTDFKFKNDTQGHLLIQSNFDPKKHTLVFEIYGTKDGRVVNMSKPIITSSTPPPEDLYVDDPTMPQGQIKQVDHKAWGAKVTFDYKVERNGEILIDKTFVSNYRPWQSVFLRGTGSSI